MSVTLQENMIKDALLVPGNTNGVRNSVMIVGEEQTEDGLAIPVVKRQDKTNTMLSLTNQIAHALKAKNQRNTKLSKRKSKMLGNSSGSDESSEDDSDFSEISESDDESGSDTD